MDGSVRCSAAATGHGCDQWAGQFPKIPAVTQRHSGAENTGRMECMRAVMRACSPEPSLASAIFRGTEPE